MTGDETAVLAAERDARRVAVEAEREAWRSFLVAERNTLRYDRRTGPGQDRGGDERRAEHLAARALATWEQAKHAVLTIAGGIPT